MPRKTPQTYAERYGSLSSLITRGRGSDAAASHEQIAEAMGISTARVHQLEKRALSRMRRCFDLIELGVPVNDAVRYCKSKNGRAL